MEIFLGLAALVAILYYGYLRFFVKPDATDLKETAVVADTPVADTPVAEKAPEPVAETNPEPAPVTSVLDVNKDGKVDLVDAKEAVKQTVAIAKTAATRTRKKK